MVNETALVEVCGLFERQIKQSIQWAFHSFLDEVVICSTSATLKAQASHPLGRSKSTGTILYSIVL